MRLLLDEMISQAIAEQVRKRGVDCDAVVARPALVGAPDDEVLTVAAREQRALVTLNIGDFVALDRQWRAEGRAHSGILLVSTRRFPMDAGFVGALTNALVKASRRDALGAVATATFL